MSSFHVHNIRNLFGLLHYYYACYYPSNGCTKSYLEPWSKVYEQALRGLIDVLRSFHTHVHVRGWFYVSSW